MQPGSGSEGRRGRVATRGLLAAGWIVAAAGAAGLWLPFRTLHADVATTVDTLSARPETGRAFIVTCPVPGPSDRGGRSHLRLRENDVELQAHALHDRIRAEGGMFSHWGDDLYLSATDGSDPRTNGRRYEILEDAPVPAGESRAAITALCSGAVLAAAGAVLATLRRRGAVAWIVAAAPVVVALGALGPWTTASRWQDDLLGVSDRLLAAADRPQAPAAPQPAAQPAVQPDTQPDTQADTQADVRAELRAAARAAERPRTLHLLDARSSVDFAAGGDSVPPPEPVILALEPGEDGALRTAQALDLAPDAFGEVSLQVVAPAGGRLLLRFQLERSRSDADSAHQVAEVEVPVSPADGAQTLVVSQPLLLQHDADRPGEVTRVTGLQVLDLQPAADADRRLQVREARMAGSLAPFQHASHGLGPVAVDGDLRPAHWQSVGGTLSRDWPEGAGRRLRGSVALLAGSRAAGARWSVVVEDAAGRRHDVAGGSVQPGDGWTGFAADLPADVTPARLLLACPSLPDRAVLAWAGLRVLDTDRPPRRVMLALVDTLRADALSCLGGPAGQTPALDALARDGALFEQCYAQAHWTRPSMPSIFSGRYVTATGVQLVSQRLPMRCETLAEQFRDAGFHTVAFITNSNAGPSAGLDRGFEQMVMSLGPRTQDSAWFLGAVAGPGLRELQDDDLFVYVHLMEAHSPYGPVERPAGWRPTTGTPVTADPWLDRPWSGVPTAEGRIALYGRDVLSLDAALGAFLGEWLGAWEASPGPPTVVAVMADHGELLGEHGKWEHGWFRLEPALVHVPLILRAPGLVPAGTVCREVVQNIDVGATLLDLAGAPLPPPDPGRGRSLVPLLDGGTLPRAFAVASGEVNDSRLFTVVTRSGGLIGVDGDLLESFDADGERPIDPSPALTLWSRTCSLLPSFDSVWSDYLESQRRVHAGLLSGADAPTSPIDAASLEQMRSLGYLGR